MHMMLPKALIAAICLLPTTVFAADSTPDAKPPTVLQTVEAAPPAAAPKTSPEVQKARLGFVDMGRIATDSSRGKALKSLLLSKKAALQGKIDTKKKALEKQQAAIGPKLESMTPQQREAKSKEFRKKLEEYQSFAQKSEEELLTLQEKETKSLYEAIEQSAAAHGKANNFAVIVVKRELLYLGSSVDTQDITDALIKAMDQDDSKK